MIFALIMQLKVGMLQVYEVNSSVTKSTLLENQSHLVNR